MDFTMKRSLLTSEIMRVADLSTSLIRQLFTIYSQYYDCVDEYQFQQDLSKKDYVIILRDSVGRPRGFSTQQILRARIHDVPLRAVFSGDTIIDRPYWGEQELVKGWCRFAALVRSESPNTPLYWFLISKGYRTYLYLPIFFHTFYPRYDFATPPLEKEIMDALADAKFAEYYDPKSGLIEFPKSRGQVVKDLAGIPPNRLRNAHVRFFLLRNPHYAQGTELVCLAKIAPDNMRGLAARIIREEERLEPLLNLKYQSTVASPSKGMKYEA